MARTTRREFLATTTAALLAPAVLRPAALGAAGHPDANDRVGVGFIGVGGRGRGHLGRYAKSRAFPALAVCDVDASYRARAAESVGSHCVQFDDYRRLLDRKDIDAVVISTPDHWHGLNAVHACEAGKDVYCEKPLSLTIGQGAKMVEAARRYSRVFQTGSQQRSAREFRKACELVRNGRIGDIKTVKVNVWGTSRPCHLPAEKVPAGLDWNQWIGPARYCEYNKALHPFKWRSFREFSGGMMTDWGAHHLDIVQWGLGMDESGPVEVLPPMENKKFVTYKYSNGVIVECGQVGVNGVEFAGALGKITVNRGFFKADPAELGREDRKATDVRLYESPGHHEDWQRCIHSRKRPICDVSIGYRSVTLCHLGNFAIWSGRAIRWDPARQKIIADPQLSRWLDRPLRAPYAL